MEKCTNGVLDMVQLQIQYSNQVSVEALTNLIKSTTGFDMDRTWVILHFSPRKKRDTRAISKFKCQNLKQHIFKDRGVEVHYAYTR